MRDPAAYKLDPRVARRGFNKETRIYLQDVQAVLDKHRTAQLGAGQSFGETSALSRTPREFTVFMLILTLFALGNSSDAFLILRGRYLDPLAAAMNLRSISFLSIETCAVVLAGGMAVGCLGGLVAGWDR